MSDIYALRQWFVLSAGLMFTMCNGFMVAFSGVLDPALLATNNTDLAATPDQVSWIDASNGLSGVIGFFIHPPLMEICGRRTVFIVLNAMMATGWAIFIFANSVTTLLAARIIQGITIGGFFISFMVVGEYSHPIRRGYFTALKKLFAAVAGIICHALIYTLTWRQIAMIALVPAVLGTIIPFFWPESPYFLAKKGRFEECEKSFTWLHGNSMESEKELKLLIATQKEEIEKRETPTRSTKPSFLSILFRKECLKSLIVVIIMVLVTELGGRHYLLVFITQFMLELVTDRSIAVYLSIATDLLVISALLASCFVISKYKRRTILFTCGSLTVLIMFSVMTVEFLQEYYSFSLIWLTPSLIMLHGFVVNLGVVSVGFTVSGELFPLNFKGIGSVIAGICMTCVYALFLKLTPLLTQKLGVQGLYGIYAICIVSCLGVVYFILPETKDKTLQEIEDCLKGVERKDLESKSEKK